MREKNKRTFIIIALVVTILFIGVGYAALRQALIITGTASIGDASWDVKITDIREGTMNGATTVEDSLDFDNTSATFSTVLAYPGASASYVVTIYNNGSIDAILDSISGVDTANQTAPTELVFSVSGVEEDVTTLDSKDTNQATVTVTWVPNEATGTGETIPTTTSKTATITLNYVQNPNPDETN